MTAAGLLSVSYLKECAPENGFGELLELNQFPPPGIWGPQGGVTGLVVQNRRDRTTQCYRCLFIMEQKVSFREGFVKWRDWGGGFRSRSAPTWLHSGTAVPCTPGHGCWCTAALLSASGCIADLAQVGYSTTLCAWNFILHAKVGSLWHNFSD